jgi:hypothetical protein
MPNQSPGEGRFTCATDINITIRIINYLYLPSLCLLYCILDSFSHVIKFLSEKQNRTHDVCLGTKTRCWQMIAYSLATLATMFELNSLFFIYGGGSVLSH